MRISGVLRRQPTKRYVLNTSNELQKPYWEYTGGQLFGKDTTVQGSPWQQPTPRLAPHIDPRGLVESVPREMEDMSNFFNASMDEFGNIDNHQVRDQFDDMSFFAKRYAIIIQRRMCSSGIHNPQNRDVFDIWLRDLKAKSEESQIHTGQKLDIELLGQFDGQPNYYNEKIMSLDVDKILYYIGLGVSVQQSVLEILGILGYLPVHPSTELRMMKLHETRRNLIEDSGRPYDRGGYYAWADEELTNILHGQNLQEDAMEQRKEMIKSRTLLREKRSSTPGGVESTKEQDSAISYDDDDDDF